MSKVKSYSVLLVEDNPGDVRLIREYLKESSTINMELNVAGTLSAAFNVLPANGIDAVLLDLTLPDSKGLDTFYKLNWQFPTIPIIILTGLDDKETALTAVQNGAQDYLPKSQINPELIVRSLTYSIERKQTEKALRESEQKYRKLIENSHDIIFTISNEGIFQFVSPAWTTLLGHPTGQVVGKSVREFVHPDDISGCIVKMQKVAITGKQNERLEYRVRHLNGAWRWHTMDSVPLKGEDGIVIAYEGTARDITDRIEAEIVLHDIITQNPMPVQIVDKNGHTLLVNPAHTLLFGLIPQPDLSIFEHLQSRSKEIENLVMIARRGEVVHLPDISIKAKKISPNNPDKFIWIRTVIFPLINSSGNPEKFVLIHENITENKKAEDALRQSESLLRSIAENSDDLIFVKDRECRFVFANPATCKLNGKTQEQLIGHSKADFHPEVKETSRFVAHDLRVIETGKAETMEEEMTAPDGKVHTLLTTKVPLHDGQGNIIGLTGVAHDITKRKKAEKSLKESEKRYRLITEKITDVVWLMDMTGKSRFVSPSIEKFTGFTVDEYLNQTFNDRFTNESAAIAEKTFLDEISRYYSEEIPLNNYKKILTLDYRCKDGGFKTGEVLITPDFDENNICIGLYGVTRDITERKEAELALHETEEKNRLLIETMGEGMGVVDENENFVFVNPAAERTFGVERGGLVGRNLREFVDEETFKFITDQTNERRKGLSNTYEHEIILPDGNKKHVNVSLTPQFDKKGKFIGTQGIFMDVTERRLAEEVEILLRKQIRTILDLVPSYIFAKDYNGKFIMVNKSLADLFKVTADEVVGKTDADYGATPEQIEWYIKNDRNVIDTGEELFIKEEQVLRKDGSLGWFQTNKIPYTHPGSNEQAILGVAVDITERKQIEDALRENERLLSESQAIARIGSFAWYMSDGLWYSSKTLDEIFGIEKNYLRSLDGWANIVHAECRDEMLDYVKNKVLGKYQKFDKEYQIKRINDGEVRWVHGIAELEFDSHNQPIRLIGTISDITQHKQSEVKIRESEEQFRSLFENSIDSVAIHQIVLDEQGKPIDYVFLQANEAFEISTDLIAANIIGKRVTEVIPGIEKTSLIEIYGNVAISGRAVNFEQFIEPMHRFYHINAYQVGPGRFATIFQDITERKHAEEVLSVSEKRYRTFIDANPDFVFLKDEQFRHIVANKSLCRFYNKGENEIIGKTDFDLIDGDFATNCSNSDEDAITTNGLVITEEKWGDNVYESVKFPVEYKKGHIGVGGFVKDITERKKAEEVINMLAHAVRSISECVSITDMNDNIIFVNNAFLKTYQYEEKELIGKNISIVRSPGNSPKIIHEILPSTLEKGWQGELLNKRKDGSEFPVFLSSTIIVNEKGESVALIGIAIDITERKQAEEKSRKLSTAVEQSSASIVITNVRGDIEYVNPKFSELTGYTSLEVIGCNPRFLKSGITSDEEYLKLWDTITSGKVWKGEFCNKKKNGEFYWEAVSISPIINESGEITHYVAVKDDISEQKRIQEELFRSEEKYRTIFENVQDVFFQTDLNGIISELSPSIKNFSDFNREDLLKTSVYDLYYDLNDRGKLINALNKNNEVVDYELKLKTKTGLVKDVSINARLVFDYYDKPHHIDGAIRDVTERKRNRELLRQAYENLEIKVNQRTAELAKVNFQLQIELVERQKVIEKEQELSMLKSRFISVVSHEFRTPLAGIYSNVQLLERYGNKWDVEKKVKYYKTIYNSIRFANLLLEDVSIVGKDESGKMSYNPSVCKIEEICKQAVVDIKAVFGKFNRINFSIEPESLETFADESLLRHILNNILSNALKYSEEEKEIDFIVAIEIEGPRGDKNQVINFTITDHGIGIPKEDQKYLFEPFHRATNVESIKGTGLGLSIVKRCVEMHNGTIEVKSKVNKGTTVIIKIPYNKPDLKKN